MKKTFILTVALSASILTSCIGNGEKEKTDKEKAGEIGCTCAEKAVNELDDQENPSMDSMVAAQEAYARCLNDHADEIKELKRVNDMLFQAEMKKKCEHEFNLMIKMQEAM